MPQKTDTSSSSTHTHKPCHHPVSSNVIALHIILRSQEKRGVDFGLKFQHTYWPSMKGQNFFEFLILNLSDDILVQKGTTEWGAPLIRSRLISSISFLTRLGSIGRNCSVKSQG